MITSDSRYASAGHENALTHLYDSMGNAETVAVTDQAIPGLSTGTVSIVSSTVVGTSLTEVSRDTTYLLTTALGTPPPRQYMVKQTDNIQLLSYRSLADPTQWWVIADANPHIRYPFDFVTGQTIHLPE